MRIHLLKSIVLLAAILLLATSNHAAAQTDELAPIDPVRGRQLMQKSVRGEALTTEEQAYLDRVKMAIRERATRKRQDSPPANPARRSVVDPSDWDELVPITDLRGRYRGEDGGLYGSGNNEPPEGHRAAHVNESRQVRPLDASGAPSDEGKIGLITIGFSNTSIETAGFKRAADADPQKTPRVVIVNGAIGGRSAVMWAWDGAAVLPKDEQERLDKQMDLLRMPKTNRRSSVNLDKDTWPTLALRIKAAELTPHQVQVCWLKHVEANPRPLGDFPAHARALQADITAILKIAKHRYPNLRIVYMSSRTFGGWSGRQSGSPEPFAYESGFSTRWIVLSQIEGDPRLNFDPKQGEVLAPLVLWGPYLWARGDSPRKLDGLTWTRKDVRADLLHPNEAGTQKTTTLLLNFFKTNEGTCLWFVKQAQITPPH